MDLRLILEFLRQNNLFQSLFNKIFVLKFYLAILQRLKEENKKNSKSSQIETELFFEIDDK